MILQDRGDDVSGFDPQTWKDLRRKEDRSAQLARKQRNKRRPIADEEDFDFSDDE